MADGRSSATGRLVRLGFADTAAARRHLEAPQLRGLAEVTQDDTGLLRALAWTPDPDLALLGLVRFLEAVQGAAGVQHRLP